MHQPDALIYLIIITHSRLLNYTDLAFPYLFERIIIIKIIITFGFNKIVKIFNLNFIFIHHVAQQSKSVKNHNRIFI